MKERLGMTEVRKAANRMSFGEVMSIIILHCTIKGICSQLCIAHLKSGIFCGEYYNLGTYNYMLGCLCDISS